MQEHDSSSATAWLEEWRVLERALAATPDDDPRRDGLREQRDAARRRYHELFAAVSDAARRRDGRTSGA